MAEVIWEEDLVRVAEELGLEHEDFDRLQSYVSLVRTYPIPDGDNTEYIRENLAKWIEWETESYYGTHESPADFAQFYFENYDTESTIRPYLVVDWQATWDRNLRHDFHFEYTSRREGYQGYVWAEVY